MASHTGKCISIDYCLHLVRALFESDSDRLNEINMQTDFRMVYGIDYLVNDFVNVVNIW